MSKLKKSGIVILVIAVVVCVVVAILCLTNKKETINNDLDQNVVSEEYNAVLEKLKSLITSTEEFDSKAEEYENNGFSYMYAFEENKDKDSFKYALYDLNDDGQKELLLYVDDEYYPNMIYDIYTIVSGDMVHVLSSMERLRYSLCKDNYIEAEYSNSAFDSGTNYYKINSNGELELVEGIRTESLPESGDAGLTYIYVNGSDGTETSLGQDEEEANKIMDKYENIDIEKEFLFGDENL